MQDTSTIFYILIIAGAIFFLWFYIKKCKHLKLGTFVFITGGVKSGKTALSVSLALKSYKRKLFSYKLAKILFPHKTKNLEMPLLYSNLPLDLDYVELTTDLLIRKERFAYNSVILVDEASLVADSQLIRDKDINNELLVFNKLISHELHGGQIFWNSQSQNDIHYSIERCISNYLYINSNTRLPFFRMLDVRELVSSNVGDNIVNNFSEDVVESTKKYFMLSKVHKKYDRYALSYLTDDLPVNKKIIHNKGKSLKQKNIISFRKEFREMGVKK